MTKTNMKRIIALILLCASLTVLLGQAFAETAYVMKSAAVYSSSGKKIGSLKPGTTVDIVAQKSGWALVSKNGKTAVMKSSVLAEIEDCTDFTAYAKSDATMYSNGKKIGVVPQGASLTVSAKAGNWACAVYNGYKGFVKISSLTTTAPSQENEQQTEETISKTVYANKVAKVYNAKGKAVGSVPLNTQMTLTGVNGNICRVVKDGKTAYMNKTDLSESKVAEESTTAAPTATVAPTPTANSTATAITVYANKTAKVYNAKGKVAGSVPVNTQMTLTGVNGSVCRVVKDGKTAYMKKSDLSTSKVESEETADQITAYAKQENTRVYNSNGKVIATVGVNTVVTVTAISGDICRVVKDGVTAYMNKADLSTSKVEVKENTVVEIPDTTGYVKTDGAKVYDASGNTLATLSINTAVTVSAYNDSLVQVVNGSLVGYMKKDDISTSKVEVSNNSASYSLKYGDTGEAVKKLQTRLRELGYFSGSVGGNYLGLTQSAVAEFQSAAKLTSNGVADYKTLEALFSDNAPKYTTSSSSTDTVKPSGTSTATPAKGTAVDADWWTSNIQKLFPRGSTVTVTDVATGLAWREYRGGGTNHADVQPATKADTAVLKKVYGGKWSWTRRAIFVTINGVNYAASMNGMPHGSGSVSGNGFNGHHCIHFTNSRTHGSNKVCSLHQAAIKKALNATL